MLILGIWPMLQFSSAYDTFRLTLQWTRCVTSRQEGHRSVGSQCVPEQLHNPEAELTLQRLALPHCSFEYSSDTCSPAECIPKPPKPHLQGGLSYKKPQTVARCTIALLFEMASSPSAPSYEDFLTALVACSKHPAFLMSVWLQKTPSWH